LSQIKVTCDDRLYRMKEFIRGKESLTLLHKDRIKTKISTKLEYQIMQNILADIAVSVSELKKNPSAVLSGAHGLPVAVLNHNKVMGYMVPAEIFEAMMERLDDLDLADLIKSRRHEKPMPVDIDDL
jgi:antitoxin StbD